MLGGAGPAAVPGWPRGVVYGVLFAVAALALRADKLVVLSGTLRGAIKSYFDI